MNARFLLTWLLLFCATTIHAGGGDDMAVFRDTGARFASLVGKAEQAHEIQQLRSKEAQELISVLSDDKRFLKPGRYPVQDLGNLLDLCGMSNKAVMSLALYDVKGHIDSKADPQSITGNVVFLMQKNVVTFGHQLTYLHPFLVRCTAKQIAPMTDFVATLTRTQFTDERRKGLQQARTGLAELFVGVLQSVGDPRYDAGYREAISLALAESAPILATAMQVEVRRQIHSVAVTAQKTAGPTFRANLEIVRAALEDRTCTGLCSL